MNAEKIDTSHSNELKIVSLEKDIHSINNSIHRIESGIDKMNASIDKRFERIDIKFDRVDAKFDSMQSDMKTHLRWTLGFIGGLYILFGSAFITVLVKFVH